MQPLLHRALPKDDDEVICLDSPPSSNGIAAPHANGAARSLGEAVREPFVFEIGSPPAVECSKCRRELMAQADVKEVRH